ADGGDVCVPDLAAVSVLLDRGEAFFERGLGIDAVQVVQIDAFCSQRAEALLDLGAQHLWPAASGATEPAFGRHDAALRDGGECLADRLLALSAPVQVSGVDHLHSSGNCSPDQRDVFRWFRVPVCTQPDPSYIEVANLHADSMLTGDPPSPAAPGPRSDLNACTGHQSAARDLRGACRSSAVR